MNKIAYFSLCLLTLFSALFSEIVEVKHFRELSRYLGPCTLVILDIDDTLIIPTQTLGTDVWFCHQLEKYKKEGLAPEVALQRIVSEWQGIRFLTKMKLVEEGTDAVVKSIQDQGIPVIGLTTQGLALADVTVQHLNSVNIDLNRTAPLKEDFYFRNGQGVLYRDGILFTCATHKGRALLTYLDKAGCKPQRIVFINDKGKYLKEMESDIEERGIRFIGLRYAYCDERIAAFNPKVAEIQFAPFSAILSDDEAHTLLKREGSQAVPAR